MVICHLCKQQTAFVCITHDQAVCLACLTKEHRECTVCALADVDTHQKETPRCSLCAEELFPDDKLARLPCLHVFHVECLEKHFADSNACPTCAAPVFDAANAQNPLLAALQPLFPALPRAAAFFEAAPPPVETTAVSLMAEAPTFSAEKPSAPPADGYEFDLPDAEETKKRQPFDLALSTSSTLPLRTKVLTAVLLFVVVALFITLLLRT